MKFRTDISQIIVGSILTGSLVYGESLVWLALVPIMMIKFDKSCTFGKWRIDV